MTVTYLPNPIVEASETVQQNFEYIESWAVFKDPRTGVASQDIALQPGDLIPSGAPTRLGCLLCDGSSYLRTTYPNLFAAIGTTYGSVDGSHFNVPDLRGRLPLGAGTGNAFWATTWTLGEQPVGDVRGGAEAHVLNVSEMPAHSHSDSGHGHEMNTDSSGGYQVGQPNSVQRVSGNTPVGSGIFSDRYGNGTTSASGAIATGHASIQNTGGGGAHIQMPPVSVVNWFIKI